MTQHTLTHPKQWYRDHAPTGYEWGGFWDNLHHFQSGNYRDGFVNVACRESEITDGSLDILIKLGMTR